LTARQLASDAQRLACPPHRISSHDASPRYDDSSFEQVIDDVTLPVDAVLNRAADRGHARARRELGVVTQLAAAPVFEGVERAAALSDHQLHPALRQTIDAERAEKLHERQLTRAFHRVDDGLRAFLTEAQLFVLIDHQLRQLLELVFESIQAAR